MRPPRSTAMETSRAPRVASVITRSNAAHSRSLGTNVELDVEIVVGVDVAAIVELVVVDPTAAVLGTDVVAPTGGDVATLDTLDPEHATRTSTVIGMCGRFTSLTPPHTLAAIFRTETPNPELFDDFRPRYNVAPTTRVMAVANDSEGRRRLGRFQWGLVPVWSKDLSGSSRMINARSDTIFEKPSFRNLIGRRRCIMPLDGFFEWRTV